MRQLKYIGLLIAISATICDASTEDELRPLRAIFSAQRRAIASIEYSFHCRTNDVDRECRYSRSGDRLYFAAVFHMANDGVSMPRELAWDGIQVSERANVGYFVVSRDRSRFRPSCPTPDKAILDSCGPLFDPIASPGETLDVSSIEHEPQSHRIKITASVQGGAVVTVTCDGTKGYWPISVERRPSSSEPATYVLEDVMIAPFESNGNTLYFPVHFAQMIGANTDAPNRIVYTIDQSSLKINEPIDPSRFALKPWPNQVASDFDNDHTDSPRDPSWQPTAAVGFPFAELVDRANRTGHRLVIDGESQTKQRSVDSSPRITAPSPSADGGVGMSTRIGLGIVALGVLAIGLGIWRRLQWRPRA